MQYPEKCYFESPSIGEPELTGPQPKSTLAFCFHLKQKWEWTLEVSTGTSWAPAPADDDTLKKFRVLHEKRIERAPVWGKIKYFEVGVVMRMILELHWWRNKQTLIHASLIPGPEDLPGN